MRRMFNEPDLPDAVREEFYRLHVANARSRRAQAVIFWMLCFTLGLHLWGLFS